MCLAFVFMAMIEYTHLLFIKRRFENARHISSEAAKPKCKRVRLFTFPALPCSAGDVGSYSYAVDKMSFVVFNVMFVVYNVVYAVVYSGKAC